MIRQKSSRRIATEKTVRRQGALVLAGILAVVLIVWNPPVGKWLLDSFQPFPIFTSR